MSADAATPGTRRAEVAAALGRFWRDFPPGRVGRIVIVALVVGVLALETVLILAGGVGESPVTTIAQVVVTAAFALFAWRPAAAALTLLLGCVVSLALGANEATLLPMAVGAGLVVAMCSVGMSVLYLAAYGVGMILVQAVATTRSTFFLVAVLLILVAVSTLVGATVRALRRRARQLTRALDDQVERSEAAARAERERIADELHDFIAHELTIIVMHARVMDRTDDPETLAMSRRTIGDAARLALADIRRVLEVTHASRAQPAAEPDLAPRHRLVPTLAETEAELRAAGIAVTSEGVDDVADELSPSIDAALARFLREASTNIVKHAASADRVSIALALADGTVVLRVENTVRGARDSLRLPSGGLGLTRMKERASVLGGTFSAGPTVSGWLVEVRLPAR